MINKIISFADEHEMLIPAGDVLVCVSGGADSMCLLEIMRHISYERGFNITAAHYNHRLRGQESDRDETFVMNVCEEHGIPFHSAGSDVAMYAKRHGLGTEEAARDVRYLFFQETAEKTGAVKIATAHTMNDNTETIIMNLVRGSGTNGLSGIPPVRDNIIRPLLILTREEIMKFITERGIVYVDDSSNDLDIYTRNKVRQNVIPLFNKMNPRLHEALFSASEILRADEEFIAEIADLFINDCCIGSTSDAKDLAVLPFSVSSRVIRKLCKPASLSRVHVRDVLKLCLSENPSAKLSLPDGILAYREYSRIIFEKETTPVDSSFAPAYLEPGSNLIILGLGLSITCESVVVTEELLHKVANVNKPFTTYLFKSVDICGKIAVRPREEGDCIKLKGQTGTKTLKKYFIEKRVPARKRLLVPIICDDDGVLGIYGMGVSDRAVPSPGDEAVLINFKET